MSNEDHQTLMDLASKFAYRDPAEIYRDHGVKINGVSYELLNDIHDDSTGLDAFTFRNKVTREVTIVYVGSVQNKDWTENMKLIPSLTPPQYTRAQKYFHDTVDSYGPVSTVCGNSLGGGLAAYVAVGHPEVEAVTVNPAPVPAAYANANAPNVHNYILENDILHLLVVSGGLESRIIGNVTMIDSAPLTIPSLVENHIGSDRNPQVVDPSGEGFEVGYNASMAVPFSLFHHNQVVRPGEFGERLQVTAEGLLSIADGLDRQRADLYSATSQGFYQLTATLTEELGTRSLRSQLFKRVLASTLEGFLGQWLLRAGEYHDQVRQAVQDFDRILPPGPVQWVWDECQGAITSALNTALGALAELANLSIDTLAEAAWISQKATFFKDADAIVAELLANQEPLTAGLDLTCDRWAAVATHTRAVQTALAHTDAAIAAGVANGTCPPAVLDVTQPPWPTGAVRVLESSSSKLVKEWIIRAREQAAGGIIGAMIAWASTHVIVPLNALIETCAGAFKAVELAMGAYLDTASLVVAGAGASLGAMVMGIDDDLRDFHETIQRKKREFEAQCAQWFWGLHQFAQTLGHLPLVIQELIPRLANGVFSDAAVENVYNIYAKCRNLTEHAEITFAEIVYQYGDHTALAINAIAERATQTQHNLAALTTNYTSLTG